MYFWKCWRDTRGAFCTFLGAIVGMAVLDRAVAEDPFGLIASGALGGTLPIWQHSVDFVLRTVTMLMPLASFVIGALGVGSEFGKNTLPFLLTRPRSRRFYLWSSWLVGAAEVSFLLAAAVISYAARVKFEGAADWVDIGAAGAARGFIRMLVLAGVIYCLTFCFTVLLKKEQHGTNAAAAAVFAYSGLVAIVRLMYDIRIPVFWELYLGALNPRSTLPLLAVAGWLGFALVLIVVAHAYFERVEV